MIARWSALALMIPGLAAAAVLAIQDVTLIDGTGAGPQPHSTIVIRGERIDAIGPARSTRIPKGSRIIDGRGKYAIPGLWDMHVHLWYKENQLPAYVANGITGVRDMGSDFARVSAWRREILDGKAIGPHIITSGPPVAGEASTDEKLPVIVARTPEDARHAYDQLEQLGVDFIKVLSSLPHDAYIALAERARHWETDFAGHIPTAVTAAEVIEARQASVEHMSGEMKLPDEEAQKLFRQSALFQTRQVPTLTLWQRMAYIDAAKRMHDPRLRQVPASIRATWPKAEEELKHESEPETLRRACERVRLMKDCGVEVLAGTDTGDPWTIPGVTLVDELELLVKAGFTPMEALRSATALPAKYLGWDESVGVLKTGFVADLVLLRADPLQDIRNAGKISAVAVRGRYLGPAAIHKILTPDLHK